MVLSKKNLQKNQKKFLNKISDDVIKKNPRTGGPYVNFFINFIAYYFSMKTKQQKTFSRINLRRFWH